MKISMLDVTRLKKLQRIGSYSKGILIDKDIQKDIDAEYFNVSYDKKTKTITITAERREVYDAEN